MTELRVLQDLDELPQAQWDALLDQSDCPSPFMRAGFLRALRGAANPATGWAPHFLTLWQGAQLLAGCPLYLKQHSWGEYVFDQAWARAFAAHGLRYYPKAVVAVPFTPVPGSRLLARSAALRHELAAQGLAWTQQQGLSGLHLLFSSPDDALALNGLGLAQRQQPQFHWHNDGAWVTFEDFLQALRRDKRKKVQQERRRVAEAGVNMTVLRGAQIQASDWAFFYRCYAQTYAVRGQAPYLPPEFFASALSGTDEWVLLRAEREGQPVAAALLAVDGVRRVAYGRHWGALQDIPCLHFELCYYAPLAWCIDQGIARFEGGAQGEHKMARGLMPVSTSSHHGLTDAAFHDAVLRFTEAEQAAVAAYEEALVARSPFR